MTQITCLKAKSMLSLRYSAADFTALLTMPGSRILAVLSANILGITVATPTSVQSMSKQISYHSTAAGTSAQNGLKDVFGSQPAGIDYEGFSSFGPARIMARLLERSASSPMAKPVQTHLPALAELLAPTLYIRFGYPP